MPATARASNAYVLCSEPCLFGDRAVDKLVSVLSGGERARVALAKILVRPGNVLLMDEPTNHLDLQTTEALTDALATYDGTLLFVSHNRAFIRRLATKLWVVHDGGVESYAGTLDDYLWSCQQRDIAPRHRDRDQTGRPETEPPSPKGTTSKRS